MANDDNHHEDYEVGKLFVGGLSWDTTKDSLGAHFSQFGELSDCTVMYSRENDLNKQPQPRGFGFVTYKDPDHAQLALLCGEDHMIDKRKVDPKRATKTESQPAPNKQPLVKSKVFLGGLPSDASTDDIRCALLECGKPLHRCEDSVEIKYDKATGRSRGFGFATFESDEGASAVVEKKFITIKNKQVEVKPAESPDRARAGRGGGYSGGGYGGGHAGGGYDYQTPAYASTQQQHHHHSGQQPYAYGSGYSAYPPQQWSYDQYTGGAAGGAAAYYPQQQGSTAANYSTGSYGNGYNSSRGESGGATFSTGPQSYSYPQQQPAYGYQGYGGSGGGRSQMPQQGYSNSFGGSRQ